jgi:hypothetical protein
VTGLHNLLHDCVEGPKLELMCASLRFRKCEYLQVMLEVSGEDSHIQATNIDIYIEQDAQGETHAKSARPIRVF